jgi:transcriptional regulator with PAS, ATPase and Fis domain
MTTPPQLIGCSNATRQVLQEVDCAANSDAKVLITGESGVGKEVVAQLIHSRSRRRQANLVAINCAGVPDTLLASELFGHVRGSFTDAHRDKQGWLEQANRGTIFMDEIGEMSLQMQALLLRFLESGEIQRVGSDRATPTFVDVRIIAATNRRLIDQVASSSFRSDLFYRLNVIHIEIPPLRDRREDILPLLDHFQQQFSEKYKVQPPRLSPEALAQLVAAPWPGNVRQLRNIVERLVVRGSHDVITTADLPREVLSMRADTEKGATIEAGQSIVDQLFSQMVRDGQSFWTVVYEPFMSRDITREDIRSLIREGLLQTRGGYKAVAALFNVPTEGKRLLSFLRKHDCHLPDQLRAVPAQFVPHNSAVRSASGYPVARRS